MSPRKKVVEYGSIVLGMKSIYCLRIHIKDANFVCERYYYKWPSSFQCNHFLSPILLTKYCSLYRVVILIFSSKLKELVHFLNLKKICLCTQYNCVDRYKMVRFQTAQ